MALLGEGSCGITVAIGARAWQARENWCHICRDCTASLFEKHLLAVQWFRYLIMSAKCHVVMSKTLFKRRTKRITSEFPPLQSGELGQSGPCVAQSFPVMANEHTLLGSQSDWNLKVKLGTKLTLRWQGPVFWITIRWINYLRSWETLVYFHLFPGKGISS